MPDVMSPSQRARTILATSSSAHVTGAGFDEPLAQPADRLVLCADPVADGQPVQPVEVEVADAAPLTTRERIRGRVRISGCAVTSAGCGALHVHPREVVLLADGDSELAERFDAVVQAGKELRGERVAPQLTDNGGARSFTNRRGAGGRVVGKVLHAGESDRHG